jgi:hypothetical protein
MSKKEVIFHQFEDLAFIHDGLLKHLWTGGGHGEEKERSNKKIEEGTGSEMCAWRNKVAAITPYFSEKNKTSKIIYLTNNCVCSIFCIDVCSHILFCE